MKILSKKIVYKGKFVKVIEKKILTRNGKKQVWECVARKDAVYIFALTKKQEVILERIFRVPLDDYVISLPAGMLDKKRENKKEAAKRELLEETGYLAKKLIPLLMWPLNPGASMEKVTLFFAPDVEFIGESKSTEDAEEIEVIKVPLKKLENFLIKQSKKTMVDLKLFGVMPLLKKKKLI